MFEVFKYVDKFFTSLTNYLTYNDIFIIFVGLFLLTAIVVIFSTANAYEAKLIKAIDKFNSYFIDNPQINEENLVAFNAKMKSKSVPKQLRKSWQQFVLYRENKASTYMSFENCVSNPIKNSSYKRDTRLMNVLSYIFSVCALILNCYYCYETADLASVLSSVLLTPIIILLLNFIMQIFFHVKHSAIVSDLFSNYQYFEVNIDKATETLPEYVDYEVLFDRNEIKKGIPILYAYLQKRAEEEQRELERARLRNVEHEKFNFDDTGVEASLVLERAMQEAENYIAERKKYIQDTEQINSDITQEDMNYREITKEYNRQMQVSKETFANFKAQLEEVSSTIEANYLKKQQQQELDRQRNLERDFDTATERHKKVIESYQAELDTVDKFIAESRNALERAMKSEFATYSIKVYDEAKKVVEEREIEKYNKLKKQINDLEEELVAKNQELDRAYSDNQLMTEKLESLNVEVPYSTEEPVEQPQYQPLTYEEPAEQQTYQPLTYEEPVEQEAYEEPVEQTTYQPLTYEEPNPPAYETYDSQEYNDVNSDDDLEESYFDEFDDDQEVENQPNQEENIFKTDEKDDEPIFNNIYGDLEFDDEEEDLPQEDVDQGKDLEKISTEPTDDGIKPASNRGRPRKSVDAAQGEKKTRGPGRPRKIVEENKEQPKRKVGRPKKVEEKPTETAPKRGRGRPKKVQSEKVEVKAPSKGRGRPRKQVQETKEQPKRKVGRPRKVEEKPAPKPVKKGRGRPKKVQTEKVEVKQVSRGRGRPRKTVQASEEKSKNLDSIVDIDEYIKQIDNAIAEENAKLEETQKELAKNAKLRRKK